jgi:hypothetical protein
MKIPVGKHFLTIISGPDSIRKKRAGENFSGPFLKKQR